MRGRLQWAPQIDGYSRHSFAENASEVNRFTLSLGFPGSGCADSIAPAATTQGLSFLPVIHLLALHVV